jgi:ABC-type amino acid transport substrate-binding protein
MPRHVYRFFVLLVCVGLLLSCQPGPAPQPAPPAPTAMPSAPTPAPAPTKAAPTKAPPPNTPVAQVDDWGRVQAAGKLIAGTSANYPPFAYRTADFKVDGFDTALATELGRRLGVPVEIQDFAFEGLLDALQLGQVDMALGAISVTPERADKVGFTRQYYSGEDAILVRPDDNSPTIRLAENMAGKKVGVQRGSVYQAWLQSALVDKSLMPSENLVSFTDMPQVLDALKNDTVDVVAMDYLPAQTYITAGTAKMAGRGLNPQNFAVATRKGSNLEGRLDQALVQLQAEGFIGKLAEKYLSTKVQDLPTPVPPTPVPAAPTQAPAPGPATATPVPPCMAGMTWVQDLTYDDHGMTTPAVMQPGQAFTKAWRVRNSGTCPWGTNYKLVYVTGNVPAARMNGAPIVVGQPVPVNGTLDLQLNLIAPPQPGTYQGVWQLVDDKNVPFGPRIWVGIQVPGAPTPVPAPTQPPDPTISFSANRTSIRPGERVRFNWNAQNVKAVYFYVQGQPWEQHGVAGVGNAEVAPNQSTIYELRVVRPNGQTDIRQIRIQVTQNPPAPTPVPGPTYVPAPTAVPTDGPIPVPTAEPLPTYVPAPTEPPPPTDVPQPTWVPAPTEEPEPTPTPELDG